MADAAADRSRLPPLVRPCGIQVLRILMTKVANCSERKLANRAHAKPIRQVLRGQSTEHASVSRRLVMQRQQHELEVEDVAFSAAAAGASNSSDRFARHRSDKVTDAACALLIPEAEKDAASQLPAEGRAQPGAGDAERVPGGGIVSQNECVGERPAD